MIAGKPTPTTGRGRPRVGQAVVCTCGLEHPTCGVTGVLVATWTEAEPMGEVRLRPARPWRTMCRMSVLRLAPWGVARACRKNRRRG